MSIVQKKIDGSVYQSYDTETGRCLSQYFIGYGIEEWTDPSFESPLPIPEPVNAIYCHPTLEEPPKYD